MVIISLLMISVLFGQSNETLNQSEIIGSYHWGLYGFQTLELKSDSSFYFSGTFHSAPRIIVFSYGNYSLNKDTVFFKIDSVYYCHKSSYNLDSLKSYDDLFYPITDEKEIDVFCYFSNNYSIIIKYDEYMLLIPDKLFNILVIEHKIFNSFSDYFHEFKGLKLGEGFYLKSNKTNATRKIY